METFGDELVAEVTTAEVSRFLRRLDEDGFTPRNVNKYRQVLQAMFTYGTAAVGICAIDGDAGGVLSERGRATSR